MPREECYGSQKVSLWYIRGQVDRAQAALGPLDHSITVVRRNKDPFRVRYNRVIPHSAVGRHGRRWSRTMRTVLALSESPNHSEPPTGRALRHGEGTRIDTYSLRCAYVWAS